MLLGEVNGAYERSQILRTRIRVRMDGNGVIMCDVISVYVK